jgi:hypothetical protein
MFSKTLLNVFSKRKAEIPDLTLFRHALDTLEQKMNISIKDYMIGGSLGLYLQGFPLSKSVHDIDLIMPDTPKICKKLDYMVKTYGDELLFHQYFTHEPNYYAFKIDGMEYNVWVVPNFKSTIFTDLGPVQSAYLIMKYKKTYGRDKDQDYFDKLIRKINL